MDPVSVRPLSPSDRGAWDDLWAGYLRFYRGEVEPAATELTFTRMTEGRDGCFGLAAIADDAVIGLAHCIVHPSTWSVAQTCYLEDLFVAPAARGSDAGRALIEAAGEHARERGADVLYWHTQAFNGRARSLYDTVAHLTSHVHYERDL